MKVLVATFALAVLFCCLLSSIEAGPNRQKRSVARENCPANQSTYEKCLTYAKEQSKLYKHCHTYVIGEQTIEWQSCGTVICGDNARRVPEDLNKPYPECCEFCEVVDHSKPATFSAVG